MTFCTAQTVDYGRTNCRASGRSRRTVLVVLATLLIVVVSLVSLADMWVQRVDRDMRCSSSLGEVITAIELYRRDTGGYPQSLQQLIASGRLHPVVLTWDGSEERFIYAAPRATPQPDDAILWEPLSFHHNGIHVLYADGHVAWVSRSDARTFLEKSKREWGQ